MSHYLVALSFAEERREITAAVAEHLAAALGRERVFFYPFHEAELARPDLNLFLQSIYRERSRLVVVFLDHHHPEKEWCGIERRAIHDLIKRGRGDQVMFVKLEDLEDPDFLSIDGWLRAWSLGPEAIAGAILKRLQTMEGPDRTAPSMVARATRPGLFRGVFDRLCPRLHRTLTHLGVFPEPPELPIFDAYMRDIAGKIETGIRDKTYLPLRARNFAGGALGEDRVFDPFSRLVQRSLRQVLGLNPGDDSATADTAALNRKSRLVRNIVRVVLRSSDPLVLLGDPGTGKTMTLQVAALALLRSESRRVFPTVTVYLRLGELHVGDGKVEPAQILAFVKRSCPPDLRPWIDDLAHHGRLVILFDGMDEMSRDRYTEHTAALNAFAAGFRRKVQTLFSCRITDFNPTFVHRRLLLLPFDRAQIARYLRLYLPAPFVVIDSRTYDLAQLAHRLARGGLPVDARNPFVLWLLCLYLIDQGTWPASRVDLLDFFQEENYARKLRDNQDLPADKDEVFREWARFAWIITERNRGAAVPVAVLLEGRGPEEANRTLEMIWAGKQCGVLAESMQEKEHQIRFEDHRFQEYFAAGWINQNGPEIDWLSKLEAPRWQETMINLVLMGGGEEGVRAVADSVKAEIDGIAAWFEERRKEWEQMPEGESRPALQRTFAQAGMDERWEASLADRVELSARLVQGAPGSPAVWGKLRPCLRDAVELFARRSRPLSQVKMMRACRFLNDNDLLSSLDSLLGSPIRWVRDQALLLVSAGHSGQGLGRTDLATSMAIHFAASQIPARWPVFARAVASAGVRRLWICFFLTTLFAVVDHGLVLAVAWGLYELSLEGLRSALHTEMAPMVVALTIVPPARLAWIQAGITVSMFLTGLRLYPSSAWWWALGSVPGGLILVFVCVGLSHGSWMPSFLLLGIVFYPLLPLLLSTLAAPLHLGTVALYLAVTRRFRDPKTSFSSIMAIARRDFRAAADSAAEFLRDFWRFAPIAFPQIALVGFIFLAVVVLVARLVLWIERVFQSLGLPYGKEAGWTAAILTVLGSVLLLLRAVSRYRESRWAEFLVRATFSILSTLILLVLVGIFSRVVGIALIAASMIAVLVFAGREMTRLARRTVGRRFPPRSIDSRTWAALFEKTKPRKQEELLLRTDHQSVGLTPAEFLRVLVEIEPLIQEDPALSTYLERRDQLEQALRQERQG